MPDDEHMNRVVEHRSIELDNIKKAYAAYPDMTLVRGRVFEVTALKPGHIHNDFWVENGNITAVHAFGKDRSDYGILFLRKRGDVGKPFNFVVEDMAIWERDALLRILGVQLNAVPASPTTQEEPIVITTCRSVDVLRSLRHVVQERLPAGLHPEQDDCLVVHASHTSQLLMNCAVWNRLTHVKQQEIQSLANGYVIGAEDYNADYYGFGK